MKRLVIILAAVSVLLAAASSSGRVGAQDGAEATISALRTQVADLRATVEARGKKINTQRTQIAELRRADATTVAGANPLMLAGAGNTMTLEQFAAGVYQVDADCETESMQVYVLDAAHDIIAFPVNRSSLGDEGSLGAEFPSDAEYKVEVYCDGVWWVTFTPL